jgi:predicted Na+-dependent transporter
LFVCAIFTGGALASAVAAPLADDGHFRTIFVSAAVGAVVLAIMGSVLRGRWMADTGRPPDDDHAATVAL